MKRTGNSKLAVVGWGRGMGHKGHMYLADAVITQAREMGADPYFFVSKTVGKDDPIYPEEKIQIYQKVFPQQATIFTAQGNLNQALQELAQMGYKGVVVVVGADQKKAFQYLEGNNKEGVPVYQSLGLKKLRVISRQETRSEYAQEEGPRATPMREILLDPNASEEDRFKVWRRDMPDVLGDEMVADLMRKAESRLVQSTTSKDKVKSMSKKIAKIKEAINNYKSKNASVEPLEEARIIDANAKVDLYYVTGSGQRQKIFQAIPQRMLDKAIQVLQSKYPNINPKNIEMRPAGYGEYTRTEGVAEAKKANTKTARKEFGKRPRAELSDKEKAKEKADSDAAWERLMAYAAAQKKEDVKEGISLDSLSRFANIIPSFAEKLVKAGFQETQETKQMLQILKLKMQGKASPEQVKWMNKQWRDIVIVALGVGMIGYSTAAAAAHGGIAAAASHGAKDAILHGLADIGLEAAAEVLATKFGIDIVKKLTHGMTTSTGQGHEHEQEKAPQQYGVSPAVAAQNQKNLEKKFQQAKLGFGGMSESVDYLDEK